MALQIRFPFKASVKPQSLNKWNQYFNEKRLLPYHGHWVGAKPIWHQQSANNSRNKCGCFKWQSSDRPSPNPDHNRAEPRTRLASLLKEQCFSYLARSRDRKWDNFINVWNAMEEFIGPRLESRASNLPSHKRLQQWRNQPDYPSEQVSLLNLSTGEVNPWWEVCVLMLQAWSLSKSKLPMRLSLCQKSVGEEMMLQTTMLRSFLRQYQYPNEQEQINKWRLYH